MKIYGYVRVSSLSQLNGFGLESQREAILEKYPNAIIHEEQGSGKHIDNRLVLQNILDSLQQGDMLVVNKLDRLARNTTEGLEIIQQLFDKGVSIHVLNVGLLENTTMGKFFLTTLLAVAEMERNIILERMAEGKQVAMQNPDYQEGRPKKYSEERINQALELLEIKSYTQVAKLTGISKSTLQRAKAKLNNSN